LDLTRTGEAAGTARLTLELPEHLPGETSIWPLTAPRLRRPLTQSTTWELSLDEITPFLAVESVDGEGPARATRRCLLKVPLIGDVIDREQRARSEEHTSELQSRFEIVCRLLLEKK